MNLEIDAKYFLTNVVIGCLISSPSFTTKKRMSVSKGKLTTTDHQILDTNARKQQFKLP